MTDVEYELRATLQLTDHHHRHYMAMFAQRSWPLPFATFITTRAALEGHRRLAAALTYLDDPDTPVGQLDGLLANTLTVPLDDRWSGATLPAIQRWHRWPDSRPAGGYGPWKMAHHLDATATVTFGADRGPRQRANQIRAIQGTL